MSDSTLRSKLIRLASAHPEFRKDLLPLLKTAYSFGVDTLEAGEHLTVEANGVYVHVWFDSGVAKTDFGHREPNSGEWQAIVTTSPDHLNLNPRGRELAREEFRYAEPKQRVYVLSSVQDFIRHSLFKFRGKVA